VFINSSLFNDTAYKIIRVLISNGNTWGGREEQINRERDRALERFGNSMGWK
jgi:hypothetical protein